jgi:hypothetical protein
MDRFRKAIGKTTAGVIPVEVTVPDLGPSFFVAAELNAENHAPVLEIQYRRVSNR